MWPVRARTAAGRAREGGVRRAQGAGSRSGRRAGKSWEAARDAQWLALATAAPVRARPRLEANRAPRNEARRLRPRKGVLPLAVPRSSAKAFCSSRRLGAAAVALRQGCLITDKVPPLGISDQAPLPLVALIQHSCWQQRPPSGEDRPAPARRAAQRRAHPMASSRAARGSCRGHTWGQTGCSTAS
jgi:hypothetical protein